MPPGQGPPELIIDLRPVFEGYHAMVVAAIDDPEPIVRSPLAPSRLRKETPRAQTPLTPRPFSWIDHLVRLEEDCLRDRQAKSLGGSALIASSDQEKWITSDPS